MPEEELLTIKEELIPYFSQEFERSLVTSKEKYDEKSRKSFSKFLRPFQIPQTIVITKTLINKLLSNYIYVELPEVQLLKYNADNYYHWHQDVLPENENKRVRVVSMSINLNCDYSGGGLEVKYKNKSHYQEKIPGAYCIFPSFCRHRALTVTEGTRNVVTFWYMGTQTNLNMLKYAYDTEI